MKVRFVRDFNWWGPLQRRCVLCKVLGLYAFKAAETPVEAPQEAAEAAIAAGAAVEAPE